MPEATLPKIGTGTEADGYRPDFSSVLGANEEIVRYKILADHGATYDVDYKKRTLTDKDAELLRRRVKGSALVDDDIWNGYTAAQKANFLRTATLEVVKLLLKGELS